MQQRLGQPHPLLVALRQLADRLLEHQFQRADADDLLDAVRERARGDLARLAEEPQQLQRRHVGVERPVLGQIPEPLRGFDALLPHVEPGNRGTAGARGQEARQHAHQRGLAGPVRPQEGHDLALGDRERHVVHGDERPVVLAKPLRVDHGGRGRRRGGGGRSRRLRGGRRHRAGIRRNLLVHVDLPRSICLVLRRPRRTPIAFWQAHATTTCTCPRRHAPVCPTKDARKTQMVGARFYGPPRRRPPQSPGIQSATVELSQSG